MGHRSRTRVVGTRVLPVPETVSPSLQSLLGRDPGPPREIPRTIREWEAVVVPTADARQSLHSMCDTFAVAVTPQCFGGVPCYRVTPKRLKSTPHERLLLGLPSGGFLFSAGERGLCEAIVMAGLTGYDVISVDYRLLPQHPFPAAIDDATAVWRELSKSATPGSIGLFGSSVGGALALALVQRAIREGLSLPGAIVCGSPWSDLSKTGDSYYTNEGVDNVLAYDGFWAAVAELYAAGLDLRDPLISPVYGDFIGFPPTSLISGTRDLFLSNTVRVHRKLMQARVPTQLHVEEAQFHMAYLYAAVACAPEGLDLYSGIERFFATYLGQGERTPGPGVLA